jgi:electron transport complex protein RnfD
MWLVGAAAGMGIFQSALGDAFASLGIALGALAGAVITETLIYYRTGRPLPFRDGSAVASALILTLLLPNRIHPVYAAAGAIFAMAVVKHSFGGLGANWLNPGAAGWLFVRFSWPETFRRALEGSSPGLFLEGPAFFSGSGGSAGDTLARSFLNDTVFSFLGSHLPGGYLDLFMAPGPGIIADRGVGGLLLGTVIITAAQVNRAWGPALYLGLYGLLIRLFGGLSGGGELGRGDILFGFCTGGTLVAAFFLTGDPATGAKSVLGTALVTAAAAGMGYLFRYPGGEPYGALLGALFFNALVPPIRDLEGRHFYEKRRLR